MLEDPPKASQTSEAPTTTVSLWWQLPTHPSTHLPTPSLRPLTARPPREGLGTVWSITVSCCPVWRQEEEALNFQELPLWDNLPVWSHLISLITQSNSYLNNNSYNSLNSSIHPFTHSAHTYCASTWLQAILMYWRYSTDHREHDIVLIEFALSWNANYAVLSDVHCNIKVNFISFRILCYFLTSLKPGCPLSCLLARGWSRHSGHCLIRCPEDCSGGVVAWKEILTPKGLP